MDQALESTAGSPAARAEMCERRAGLQRQLETDPPIRQPGSVRATFVHDFCAQARAEWERSITAGPYGRVFTTEVRP